MSHGILPYVSTKNTQKTARNMEDQYRYSFMSKHLDLSRQIQRHLDFKNTITVYQDIFIWMRAEERGQTISNYTNKCKENQKES